MTSGTLADLKRLLEEARRRRFSLRSEFNNAVSARNRAHRNVRLGERLPRRLVLRGRIATLQGLLTDTQATLENRASELASCYARLSFGLDGVLRSAWDQLRHAHIALRASAAIWDITSSVSIDRVRTRSAAGNAVNRTPVILSLARGDSDVILSNEERLRVGNANGGELDFYPGLCLIESRHDEFALVDMLDIEVQFRPAHFLEEEQVPRDARVVGRAWAKSNKDGTRDRRFANNIEIPKVLYGELWFRSRTGLNEAYMFSNAEAAAKFADAFSAFKVAQRDHQAKPPDEITRPFAENSSDAFVVEVPEPPRVGPLAGWWGVAGVLAAVAFATGATLTPQMRPGAVAAAVSAIQPPISSPHAQATVPAQTIVSHAANPVPSQEQPPPPMVVVTTKTAGYIRSGPDAAASVVRTAAAGEKLNVFGQKNGWTQVGADRPIGWIGASLINR